MYVQRDSRKAMTAVTGYATFLPILKRPLGPWPSESKLARDLEFRIPPLKFSICCRATKGEGQLLANIEKLGLILSIESPLKLF
jgi:hypothetical protein